MYSRILTFSAIAAGLFVLNVGSASAGLPTGFVNGLNCKGFHHSSEKSSKYKSVAKRRARNNWSAKMLNTYGWHFRKWNKGRFRHYDCRHTGGRHRCRAAAYPCK